MITALIERVFGHEHKFADGGRIMRQSVITGVDLQTAEIYRCKCGEERRELTAAGMQQQGWGADTDWLLGLSEESNGH